MPAHVGIHDFPAAKGKQDLLFLKKKKQKNFWFFFSKKHFFAFFLFPLPALAYNNTPCWPYAAQQGTRPDITCTPITASLLASLQNAPLPTVIALMNEPGLHYPDGTLHYTGNDQNTDGSFQGTIALTLTNSQVTGIAAKLNSPTQGGAYLYYRWTPQNFCSDLPGATPPCAPQPPY
jgi:hypothetical protein